ncbi:large ribosomal subunit protein uL5m-like [Lolium perenne]|uniref:large ribosomal subunit protein uL5m-like n=1 Tax=Lolium perenne TaxID=4522 RepID=UPI0021F51789|nr:60S ribosomal protein L5, mitochondrial-like [Lolium perenne]
MASSRAISSALRTASRTRAASPSPCPRALLHRPSPAGFLFNRAAAYASSAEAQPTRRVGNKAKGAKSGKAMMFPLHFHYEDVLREDLLLKLNHTNVMEVPGLFEIRLVPKSTSDAKIQFGKLAMEILCGQKSIQAQLPDHLKSGRSGSNAFLASQKDATSLRQSIIRGHGMYNFLVRVLTVMSMLDSKVSIEQGNCIKFFMATEFCEFSPEIEDHFEIFENIGGFNVTIVTSASSKEETSLLWSGFLLKDEGEIN